MKRLTCWICGFGLILAVGCATATYRPYVGQQQNWPTSPGSIVNANYELPAFMCPPSAPYTVLGELKVVGGLHGQRAEECLPVLAKKAREMGADALLVVDAQQFFAEAATLPTEQSATTNSPLHAKEVTTFVATRSGRYGGSRYAVMSFDPNVVILAIRWTAGPPAGLTKQPQTKQGA
jgi:hypothetical protein